MTFILATACVPKDNFTASTSGGTQTTASATSTSGSYGTSINSCGDIQGYNDLNTCKLATYAQCYPSTKTVQNATATCYFPVANWQGCSATPATWVYGNWSSWCNPDMTAPNIFMSSRSATCQTTNAACDCINAAQNQQYCVAYGANPNGYSQCPYFPSPYSCATPTPTPIPSPTPISYSWCANAILDFEGDDTILQSIVGYNMQTLLPYFTGRNYRLATYRSNDSSLNFGIPLTATDPVNAYVIKVIGARPCCNFLGVCYSHHDNVTLQLLKNGVIINQASSQTNCVSFNGVTTELNNALGSLNAPTCQ